MEEWKTRSGKFEEGEIKKVGGCIKKEDMNGVDTYLQRPMPITEEIVIFDKSSKKVPGG